MEILPFQFENNQIRTFQDKEIWFVAKDIAVALEYPRFDSNLIKKVPKEWRDTKPIRTLGGTQNMAVLSEQGLYFFVIRSDKQKALPFQKWISGEVLPQIRKTGSYSIEEIEQNFDLAKLEERARVLEISEKEFDIFERVFYKLGINRKEELAITTNRAVKKETGVDFLEIAEKKGLSTPEKYFTVTELCQIVMNGDFSKEAKKLVSTKKVDKPRPQNLNKLLEKLGFQFREDELWKATEKGKKFADFVQNKSQYSEKTVFHTVWKKEILSQLF
jgi:prophage antirepressor-like protein/signal recognition particle subunit SEC65